MLRTSWIIGLAWRSAADSRGGGAGGASSSRGLKSLGIAPAAVLPFVADIEGKVVHIEADVLRHDFVFHLLGVSLYIGERFHPV